MRRLLLFAHYYKPGAVAPWVLRHLAALRPYVGRAVLLTTSTLPSNRTVLEGLVDDAIEVENLGFDFGMWQAGLAREELRDIDELWLVNSSVLGPLSSLDESLRRVADPTVDFWSMTECLGPTRHLQSWFLALRRPVIESDAFRRFFASVLPFRDKWGIIAANEIGLTPWLTQHGFRGVAAWPFADVAAAAGSARALFPATNPTTTFATELLRLGMPYVKIDLLRRAPPASISLTHKALFPVHAARVRRELRARGITFDVD